MGKRGDKRRTEERAKTEQGQKAQQEVATMTRPTDVLTNQQIVPTRWQRFKNWWGKDKSFTDWCLAIFTAALVAVAIYQFSVMNGQLVVMSEQTDAMRTDQRAWITVSQKGVVGDITVKEGEAPSDEIIFTNTGKSPALNLSAEFYAQIIQNGQSPDFESDNWHNKYFVKVMFPNDPVNYKVYRLLPNGDVPAPLTDLENKAFLAGNAWVAIHGIIRYEDVFKVKHFYKFCMWRGNGTRPTYPSSPCTEYNQVDGD